MRKVKGRVLNYRPDLPDQRDFIYKPAAVAAPLAAVTDLESGLPGVMNQLQLSSCSWNAIALHLGFIQLIQLKQDGAQPFEYDPRTYVPPSRLFGYYNARALEGTANMDAGAYLRDGIKTANQTGVCRETLWPYVSGNVLKKPNAAAYAEAAKFKISQYMRVTTLQDMLSCLNSGYPFVFGFSVYESFYSVGKNGLVPMPKKSEYLYGGHAVTACGYNQSKKLFKVRNSWGATWGSKGNCYMPFDFLTTYGSDFWTIRG